MRLSNFFQRTILDQDVVSVFPMSKIVYVEDFGKKLKILTDQLLQFIFRPDVKCTFFQLTGGKAVGIKCAEKTAIGRSEFTLHKSQCLSDDFFKQRILREFES